jgi:acyl-CoA thioesterase FadM
MSLEIKMDLRMRKRLFMRVFCYKTQKGRFHQEVQIFDEMGNVVALGKHVCTAVELKYRHTKNHTPVPAEIKTKL